MGAASVLLSTELDLGDGVVSVVADCPFSSAEGIIAKVCRDKGIPPKIFFPAIKFGARLFGGFKLSERDPIDAVRNAKVPILLIHGTADDFVPREMSDELSNVGRNITYLNIEGAPHLMSMMYDEDAYTAALDSFHQ
jgi:pimeloyl-ACP methyl ester carboxylesterase